VLPLAIISLLFATLLVIPFLDFARLRFGDLDSSLTEEEAYFTADAGIEAVLADLRAGTDVLDAGYVLPTVTLNGVTASLSVSEPPRDVYVPFGSVFVDPESETSLSPLAGNTDFLYVVDNVKTFADFQVSWVFSPPDNGWQVTVYEGVGTGGSQLANATKNSSPARLMLNPGVISGGSYTVRFRNKSANAITSDGPSAIGEPDRTWIRVVAWKDYVIISSAGDTTLKVFARQGPGPNQVDSTLHVTTWQGPE
jgi:hypothetical protein